MNIAVLKVQKEGTDEKTMRKVVDLASEIGKAIGGITFILPLDSELLTGKIAKEELGRFHQSIHEILGI